MTEPVATSGPSWTVTSQVEATIINAAGNAVQVQTVYFTLADGTTASVNIPLNAYTVANVTQAIADKAAQLHAVNQLTSEG
jgi:hypothetical protein